MDPKRVEQLVEAIEGKDLSTAAHTWRVVLYTLAMAEEAGIVDGRLQELTHAAALHDVGKLDTPREILTKPDRLTEAEFEVIKQHPVTGFARMVSMDVEDPLILDLVRYHHERWDGLGYPYGFSGEVIPVAARYFAVIDTFDALTSIRPYRQEVGEDAAANAIAELKRGVGTRYDPDAVEMFASLYERGRVAWILHYFNDAADVPMFADAAEAARAHERRGRD
jgi:HD-GYP domain-containing protein (c-di-GMP phosphodiesterase class II)